MNIDIRDISRISVVRVFLDDGKYGDPYELSFTIKWIDEDKVEAVGLDKPISLSMWREIRSEFKKLGINKILIHRIKNGKEIRKWANALLLLFVLIL